VKLPRRKFLRLAAGAATLPAVAGLARAQGYPAKPVRIIVGFGPGGGTDLVARLLGQWLSDRLGQPFVVENRSGAGTNIATETVVRAPADGYTLLFVGPSGAINATLYDKLNFNFIRDIAPVAGVFRVPQALVVNPALPAQTVPEFIAYAKANPSKINMASTGIGSTPHLAGELFKFMTGIQMLHVPYRGGGEVMTDLLAGRVHIYFGVLISSIGYVRTGRLRALAVTTAVRSGALPDLPPVGDFVSGYEASAWYGIGVHRNTPVEIVAKLNKDIGAALADPQIRSRIVELGGEPMPMAPAEFGRLIGEETDKWAKVIRMANIKAD
jgi:tripartite-type tricarboxylate transporter receptor subunit TctC